MRAIPLAILVLLSTCLQVAGVGLVRPELWLGDGVERREAAATDALDGKASVGILMLGVVETKRDTYGLVTSAVVAVQAHGSGLVHIHSPHGVAADMRESVVDAARAAAFVAGVDASAYDYTMTLDKDARAMSGPSAGSQFALGFYVALNNLLRPGDRLDVRDDYAGTGTISAKGMVGEVGGVPEKAKAAAEDREDLFVYPGGPVHAASSDSWSPTFVDMDATCTGLALVCEQVGTLADLVDLATVSI